MSGEGEGTLTATLELSGDEVQSGTQRCHWRREEQAGEVVTII